ncbi:hypothetical protein JW898_03710 [Candidatus Woesearchaeota archaeon]|nr:hypothetical protein [Candidatus Woesearchaeota archaeon]
MRSILKYAGITLLFVLVLVSVFMLGRFSAKERVSGNPSPGTSQLSSRATQNVDVDSGSDAEDGLSDAADHDEDIADGSEGSDIEEVNLSDEGPEYIPASEDPVEEVFEDVVEEPACTNKVAGFDYPYSRIVVDVSNFQRENRGDNWASITSLKLTITNNELCTIVNPTKIKLKLNPRGKGSVWWDDDVFLPESYWKMLPGETVSEIVPVHVSYSDIYSEKDFKLTVFDDYDIEMTTFKKYITFP